MPPLYLTFGSWTVQTFTLALAIGITLSAAIGLRRSQQPGRTADLYLGALVGGVIGARVFHILLNWDYFAGNFNESFDLRAGGLDWHGAVLGGLFGLWIVAKISSKFRVPSSESKTQSSTLSTQHSVLSTLIFALPIIGFAGWYGCMAAGCGYGREVDSLANYPAWSVTESHDVFGIVAPRFNTPLFGMVLCGVVLLMILLLTWRGWIPKSRFWFGLALLSLGMFVIGFFRGDHAQVLLGLRLDQWLDFVFSFQFPVISFWMYRQQRDLAINNG